MIKRNKTQFVKPKGQQTLNRGGVQIVKQFVKSVVVAKTQAVQQQINRNSKQVQNNSVVTTQKPIQRTSLNRVTTNKGTLVLNDNQTTNIVNNTDTVNNVNDTVNNVNDTINNVNSIVNNTNTTTRQRILTSNNNQVNSTQTTITNDIQNTLSNQNTELQKIINQNQQAHQHKITQLTDDIKNLQQIYNQVQVTKSDVQTMIDTYDMIIKKYIDVTVKKLIKDDNICHQVKLLQRMLAEKSNTILDIRRQQQKLKEEVLNSTLSNSVNVIQIKNDIIQRQNLKIQKYDKIQQLDIEIASAQQQIEDGVDKIVEGQLLGKIKTMQSEKNELSKQVQMDKSFDSQIIGKKIDSIDFAKPFESGDDSDDFLMQVRRRKSTSILKGLNLKDEIQNLIVEKNPQDEQSQSVNITQINQQQFIEAIDTCNNIPIVIIDEQQKMQTLQYLVDNDAYVDIFTLNSLYRSNTTVFEQILLQGFSIYVFQDTSEQCPEPSDQITCIINEQSSITGQLCKNDFNIAYDGSYQSFVQLMSEIGYKVFVDNIQQINILQEQKNLRQQVFENMKQYCNDNLVVCILQNNNADVNDNFQKTKSLIRNVRQHYPKLEIQLLFNNLNKKQLDQILNDSQVTTIHVEKPNKLSYRQQFETYFKKLSDKSILFIDNNFKITQDTIIQQVFKTHLQTHMPTFVAKHDLHGCFQIANNELRIDMNQKYDSIYNIPNMKFFMCSPSQLDTIVQSFKDTLNKPYDIIDFMIAQKQLFSYVNYQCQNVQYIPPNEDRNNDNIELYKEFAKKYQINAVFVNSNLVQNYFYV